jgi:hypothetical protein
MAVTAQEGEAFLQSQGMAVSEDDVKTRAQKDKLEEIEAGKTEEDQTAAVAKETEEESKTTSPCKPAVIRDNTMVTTTQEGAAILEGEKRERTRGQTNAAKDTPISPTTPTKVKRTTTISQTTEASSHILGSEERGRTRSQTRRMSEREEEEPSKPPVKRSSTMAQTAKEGEEFLERQAKQAKLDENGDNSAPAAPTEAEA